MNRTALNVILAKLWDAFKQKNPQIATLITFAGMGFIGVLLFGQELGLSLPPIFDKILVLFTSLFLSFNNPSTYKILNPDESSTTTLNNE